MPSDKGIPNLVSEFKSDNIRPHFRQKYQKLAEFGILSVFDIFLAKKGVKCYPIWMEYVHVVGKVQKSEGGISRSVRINISFVTAVIFPSNKQIYIFA